ncbi:MAG: hypothetical protein RIQ81_350 [Pseudomonadota bacterium]|jgi:recombinational DNA repair protein RecT
MLSLEPLPIEEFVGLELATPAARQIMATWPLPPEKVEVVVTRYFRSMGILTVQPFAQKEVLKEQLLRYLRTSTELADIIDKARRASLKEERRKGEK